jgi:hypothetical protein
MAKTLTINVKTANNQLMEHTFGCDGEEWQIGEKDALMYQAEKFVKARHSGGQIMAWEWGNNE